MSKKKKKKRTFMKNEQSKGGKTKVVLSIMPRNATYVCQDNEGRHLTQQWNDDHKIELWQTDKWSLRSEAVADK